MLVFYSLVHSGERGRGIEKNTHPKVAGRNGASTHVTQSASFFLSLPQAWVSEGERNAEGGGGQGAGMGAHLCFRLLVSRQRLCAWPFIL